MRGVRRRENGSWVVERVIDGRRRPKTVKTKTEAIRLKHEDKALRRAEKKTSAVPQPGPRRLPKDALQLENGDWVVLVDGAVLSAGDAAPRTEAGGAIFEARYSSERGCFKDIWHSLGVKADPNFTVQLAPQRGRDPSIAAVVALLRNINERLKRVEKRLARR